MTKRVNLHRLALLALATGAIPTLAMAQSGSYFDRNNAGGVLDRPRPDYQPLGIDLGGFQLEPSLTIAPKYDDNIFAVTDQAETDVITTIEPAITARSNWSRNEVDAFANVSSNLYASHSNESTTDYSLGASGRLDVLAASNITAGFSYGRITEPRTAENTIGSSKTPVQYDQASANLGAEQTLNRLQFSENFGVVRVAYKDATDFFGNDLHLDTLDSNVYYGGVRADYALNPEIAFFVSTNLNNRSYDDVPPKAVLDRNSSGYEATVGADFDLTRLVRGQVQVGYLQQDYESAVFHQVTGPVVHARVAYYFSGLTTFTFTADRQVIDTIDPVAISFLSTQGGVQVDHELLRNVILSGRLGYETDDFKGEDRTDERFSASANASYLVNRRLSVNAGYSFLDEDSSGAARIGKYVVNVVSLFFVLQL